jgi:hypothetical protein
MRHSASFDLGSGTLVRRDTAPAIRPVMAQTLTGHDANHGDNFLTFRNLSLQRFVVE